MIVGRNANIAVNDGNLHCIHYRSRRDDGDGFGRFMKTDVEKLMSGLRTDHRNMTLLLDLLDVEAERLAEFGEPDYDLVRDIMLYMTEYPDVVHHPAEDLLYRHLKSLRSDINDEFERVETDHEHIEKFGLKLKNDVEAFLVGEDLNREEMIGELREYVRQTREHLYWEEKGLFMLADEIQGDGDWLELASNNASADDPLFGPRVARKYRRLLARIQQRVAWESQKYLA